MNVNPTAAVDDDEWQDKPVQLNRRTVATVGLVIIGALAIGLNLGLRQFSGQAQEPEARAEDNLYVQTDNPAVHQNDYSYLDATRPAEKVEPEAKPEPATQVYRQPDPSSQKPDVGKKRKRGVQVSSPKVRRILANVPASPHPARRPIRLLVSISVA